MFLCPPREEGKVLLLDEISSLSIAVLGLELKTPLPLWHVEGLLFLETLLSWISKQIGQDSYIIGWFWMKPSSSGVPSPTWSWGGGT